MANTKPNITSCAHVTDKTIRYCVSVDNKIIWELSVQRHSIETFRLSKLASMKMQHVLMTAIISSKWIVVQLDEQIELSSQIEQ